MAKQETTNTEVAVQQPTGIKGISAFLNSDAIKSKFTEILGSNGTSFIASVLSVCNQNTDLKNATTESVYMSALNAATLGLPINPNLGFAYILPYKNNRTQITEAAFQMGYKGYKQLAIRSGQYAELYAKEVYEGQKIEDNSFRGYHFDWGNKKSEKVIGYASYFKLLSGFESTFYMDIDKINAHGKRYSQTYKKGFGQWVDDNDKMCKKTVVKLHLNSGEAPLSIEMQKAIMSDQAVIRENGDIEYLDNTPITHSVEISKEEIEHNRTLEVINSCTTEKSLSEIKDSIGSEHMDAWEKRMNEIKGKLV